MVNFEGDGELYIKGNIFKGNYKAKLEFPDWGHWLKTKNISDGSMDGYFIDQRNRYVAVTKFKQSVFFFFLNTL